MAYSYIVEPRPNPQPFNRELLIITEGIDDALFLEAMLTAKRVEAGRVEIRHVEGIGKIPDFLKGVVKSPAYTQGRLRGVSLVVDADENFNATEVIFRNHLRANGLPAPTASAIEVLENRWAGLYIFPRSGENGMLEDLIIQSVADDIRTELAKSAIEARAAAGILLDRIGKRTTQIFLALTEGDICRGPGRGIRNGAIPFDHLWFEELNAFLDDFLRHR